MAAAGYATVEDNVQMSGDTSSLADRWDDTGPIIGDLADRSTASITLHEMLFDRQMRMNQRIFCIGTFVLMCCILLVLFLFLLIGFNRVMNDIRNQQHQNNQGLHMVPNFGTGIDNNILNLGRDKVAKGRYVETVRDYLDAYKKEQISRANFTKDCRPSEKPPHAWCRFPLQMFDDAGCTAENRYGFESGQPCLLFELKLQTSWAPKFSHDVTALPIKCDAYDHLAMKMNPDVTYIPSFSNNTQYGGFLLNKIPSRAISDNEGRDVSDENGETIYDLPALVIVKLRLSRSVHTTLRCVLANKTPETSVSNLAEMPGNRLVHFDILYPYAE